jgi:hypothetical protein
MLYRSFRTTGETGGKFILERKIVSLDKSLRHALSQPMSVVIHGMERLEDLDTTLDSAKNSWVGGGADNGGC